MRIGLLDFALLPQNSKRGPGRPRKCWSDTLAVDLQNTDKIWTDFAQHALDWLLRKNGVEQCVVGTRGRKD